MNSLAAPETVTVNTPTLYCEGSDAMGGHPRVYLTMKADGQVDCPYCGRRFVLAADGKTS